MVFQNLFLIYSSWACLLYSSYDTLDQGAALTGVWTKTKSIFLTSQGEMMIT